jgi:hypothetical protein
MRPSTSSCEGKLLRLEIDGASDGVDDGGAVDASVCVLQSGRSVSSSSGSPDVSSGFAKPSLISRSVLCQQDQQNMIV